MAAILVMTLTPAAAGADDPGRYRTTPAGWGWHSGATEQQVNDFINGAGQRLIDIEVINGQGSKFASAYVANSGTYHSPSWHWYYGLTYNQLVNLSAVTSGRERVLDLDNYKVGSARRYAVVTVNNQGDNAKAWWWYINVSREFIKSKLAGRRIVDLDRRPGSPNYDVVMIKNSGDDNRAWWYYYRRTPAQIKALLDEKKARLVDIERDGSGRFSIVMVRRSGEYWWWYHGLTTAKVKALAAQNGARIVDIERYQTSNGPRHAVIMLNNLNGVSTKARQIMLPAVQKAAFGFYLKRVGGPVYAALQQGKAFEPASTIKVLHLLTAMQAVRSGTDSLNDPVTWYVRPSDSARYPGDPDYGDDKNKCAYNNNGAAIVSNPYTDVLGDVVLRQMMERSDNRTTDATLNRFGMNTVNQTAADIGMTKTRINHRIGCPHDASPQPYKANRLTLRDAGRLYEGVANGSLLGTGGDRATFYELMLNGVGGWKDVVDSEAAKLGKSQDVADAFLAAMSTAVKGGSYTNGKDCPSGTNGVCQLLRRTGFGILSLPHKVSATGRTLPQHYVYGSFVDGTFKCGASCEGEIQKIGEARSKAQKAIMRPRIRAALQTW